MKKSEALEILGLENGAGDDDIKKAHRALIIANHPDKFGQDEDARRKAEEKTKLINEARDVLLSRKWDPEYATTGTPYGAPFTYNPYTSRPSQPGSTQGQNPFDGWPFPEGTFVWTTWDATGKKTTYTNTPGGQGQQDPFAQDPFTAANPFGFNPFATTPLTPQERLTKAKKALRDELSVIGVKTVILILCLIFRAPALGLYLYTIGSIGQGIYKRLSFLSIIFVVPLAMLALIFAPGADTTMGIFGVGLFAISIGFDIANIRQHIITINKLKKLADQ